MGLLICVLPGHTSDGLLRCSQCLLENEKNVRNAALEEAAKVVEAQCEDVLDETKKHGGTPCGNDREWNSYSACMECVYAGYIRKLKT